MGLEDGARMAAGSERPFIKDFQVGAAQAF